MADRYEYSNKYRTPIFRGAFANNVFKPDDNGRYGLHAIIEKGGDASIVRKAMSEVATKMWGDKAAQITKNPKFKNPIKDGGTVVNREGELYAGFEEGQVTFKLTTKNKPEVVDAQVRTIEDASGKTLVDPDNKLYEAIDENAVYSGAYYIASFHAMAFDREDGFGISFRLENLQLVRPGERLGGGGKAKARDDFQPVTVGSAVGARSTEDLFG